MGTYYAKAYNSYGLDRPIRKGDRVEVLDFSPYHREEPTVTYTGTVVRFDNRKASEGYTVLVNATRAGDPYPTEVWCRPDELREVK